MKVFSKKMRFGLLGVFMALCFIVPLGVKFAPPAYAASMEFLNTFYAAIGRTFIAVTPPTDGLIVEGRVGIGEPYPLAKFTVSQNIAGEGTVANIASGTTVAGTGTYFTESCKIGDYISVAGTAPVAISAITSDTLITVGAITAAHSGAAYSVWIQGDGTVTNSAAGTAITGTTTHFTDVLRAGDTIWLSGSTVITSVVVTTVTSDTALTVPAITAANTGIAYIHTNRPVLKAKGNGEMQLDELKMKTFRYDALADDATFNLPDATDGYGFIKCGAQGVYFLTTAAGAVVLVGNTSGVTNVDADNNLCIYDGGTYAIVKNRTGAAALVKGTYWYK